MAPVTIQRAIARCTAKKSARVFLARSVLRLLATMTRASWFVGLLASVVAGSAHALPRTHDDLYLRLAGGFSGYSDAIVERDSDRDSADATISGVATASEFALGGTVARGLVLGGGVYSGGVLSYELTVDRGRTLAPELARPGSVFLVSPVMDWYFDEQRGLHAQAGLGLALLAGLEPEDTSSMPYRDPAPGGGLMLGAGYEFFVGDEWSLGVLGRGLIAVVVDEDDDGRDYWRVVGLSPSLMLTATYH